MEQEQRVAASMLDSAYLSVLGARDREGLRRELVRFARQLGFETVAATAIFDQSSGDPVLVEVDNTPAAYRDTFMDREQAKQDPVSQHCKHHGTPTLWDQSTYVRAGRGAKWELQAQFGYRHGIAVAFHLPAGRHFMLGMDRDRALPNDSAELTRITAAFQLFAAYACEAAMPLMKATPADALPRLSARELETLRWTMEGKTAWEVARILSISEQTAARHLHHAARKLGCVNKHQAVLKALRLGLVS